MDFKKKLNLRLCVSITMLVIGIALIVLGFFKPNETYSSFGLMFAVIGIARLRQCVVFLKNKEKFHKREVAENDERNIMLWTRARSLSFTIYIVLDGIAVFVLSLLDMPTYASILSYNLLAFLLIYWICYFIMSKKY